MIVEVDGEEAEIWFFYHDEISKKQEFAKDAMIKYNVPYKVIFDLL